MEWLINLHVKDKIKHLVRGLAACLGAEHVLERKKLPWAMVPSAFLAIHATEALNDDWGRKAWRFSKW